MAVDRLSAAGEVPILDADLPRPDKPRTGRPFIEVLGETARPPPATGPPGAPGLAPTAKEATAPVRALAQGAFDAEREIDGLLAAAASGRTFSATELLALQIKVFRYSQAVEIISRAADRVVGAVKQAMGTQV
jgi:hypothetical protein